ncbi:MAG: GMC family oxidoreductase [Gammaproteobacteria bacterium]|nr:GMC family oxidoreductase [Gammaproteobacteria bacterium]
MATFDLNDNSVVVIIGSGAGGATLGNELAQKGVKVVCLEAGPRLQLSDISNDFFGMFGKLSWLDKRVGSGALDPELPAWICKTVGGTTMHWAGASLRFQAHEWQALTTYGSIRGANLLDWPTTHEEMEPYYSKAEKKMGTTGTDASGLPRLPGNNNFKVLHYGAKKVGYQEVHTGNMSVNSRPYDNRPQCRQIGFCMSGCPIGARWSTLYTEVPRAEATGNFELRPDSHAVQIEHDSSGKASGVVYIDAAGNRQRQKARVVCVAGNSIETPRLLLLSESSKFPDGLANSSGQVGKNYMPHLTGAVYAIMPGEVNLHRGTQMAGIIRDEQIHQPERGFAAGYELETLPAFGMPGFALYAKPGGWGREYARDIEAYRNAAGLWIVGEDLPQQSNAVTLDAQVKDQHGLPVAHVHREDHANDTAMRNHAFKAATAVYEAAGARKVYTRGPFSSSHNLGTCRQSAQARDGVCNKFSQTHDIGNLFIADGSQFTTSAAENPTLTIVALAIRQADYLAGELSAGNI